MAILDTYLSGISDAKQKLEKAKTQISEALVDNQDAASNINAKIDVIIKKITDSQSIMSQNRTTMTNNNANWSEIEE